MNYVQIEDDAQQRISNLVRQFSNDIYSLLQIILT